MTPSENKIREAQLGRSIRTMKVREVKVICSALMPHLCHYAGRKATEPEMQELSNDLATDIYDDFKNFTIEEARLFLEMGLKREFGDFKWLTGSVMYGWLKKGVQLSANVRRMAQPRDYKKMDFNDPALQKEFYDVLIDTVKKFKEIPYWNYCPVYHYMVREGMLKLTDQDKKEIRQRIRMLRTTAEDLRLFRDEEQFDVIFRAQAVKEWLTKTYGVKKRQFKIKNLGNNLITLTAE